VFLLSPKSCANLWNNLGDRELDLGELTRGCCSSRASQPDRSDRCIGLVGFALGECLGEFFIVSCCCCFEFGLFWSSGGQVCVFGASWLRPV
jgi:hypothetical protein